MSIVLQNETYEKLMASAKKIGELAESEAHEADKHATISENVVDLIKQEGINKLILPKQYGGPQISFSTFADLVKTVGYHNLSAAWLTYFYALHNSWAAYLPNHRMDEIVNEGGLLADIFAPIGQVKRVVGGFILSGQWNFVSGVNYSTWISVGAMYQYDEARGPEHIGLCMRVSALELVMNWDPLGLRGSGSNSVIAKDLFVPDDMVIRFAKVIENRRPHFEMDALDEDYLYYDVPYFSAFYVGFPAMALGAAERLLKEFRDRTDKRVRMNGLRESESAKSQRVLSTLAIKYKEAQGLLRDYIDMLETDKGQHDPGEYNAIRVTIVQTCVDIAVKLTLTMGASALARGNVMEVMARDLLAIGTHITSLYEDGIEGYGRYLFGYPSNVLG